MREYARTIMILADGAREDVMRDLCRQGRLENIQKYMVEPGSLLTGVTTFPSTTGPAYFPFLTGCTPGRLNVPGIRWFDKHAYADSRKKLVKFRSYVGLETFLINQDMGNSSPTVFDLLPKSYTIFNSVTRGAGARNCTKIMRIWYWYYAHLTDRWEFVDEAALQKTLEVAEDDFDFIFVVFPGIDEYAHLAHPHHEKTLAQYDFLDRAVGEIARKLQSEGRWEDTQLWIVSDHGLSRTHTHFCVNTFMEKRGIPPFYYPKVMHRRGKQVANMMSGNGMTHLYFRGDSGWGSVMNRTLLEKKYPGLLSDLLASEAVDLLMVRNEAGGIDILSKRGEAQLAKLGTDSVRYHKLGADPFGYVGIDGLLDRDLILNQTIHTDYPDAPWQVADIFQATRTGDVVLSAAPGFDFRLKYEVPEHRGSHGSLHREHMHVPVVTNVPLQEQICRTVDVFPTFMSTLGRGVPDGQDGKCLTLR